MFPQWVAVVVWFKLEKWSYNHENKKNERVMEYINQGNEELLLKVKNDFGLLYYME